MIRTSDSTKFLVAALAEFHKTEISVPKGSYNPFHKSKYADLFTIKTLCDPELNNLGLVITQFPGISEQGDATLITRLCHSSGEFMEAETRLHLPKDDPQAQGSAITYMRRYAYSAILGIVADEDDDAEKAAMTQRTTRPAQAPPQYEEVNGEQIPTGQSEDPITRSGPPSLVASAKQVGFLRGLLKDAGYLNATDVAAFVNAEAPPWPDSLNNLSKIQASTLINILKTE